MSELPFTPPHSEVTPPRKPKELAVYAATRQRGVCKGPTCRARIEWATLVGTGRKMCFSGSPAPLRSHADNHGRIIDMLPLEANHWATCPDSSRFKRRREVRA